MKEIPKDRVHEIFWETVTDNIRYSYFKGIGVGIVLTGTIGVVVGLIGLILTSHVEPPRSCLDIIGYEDGSVVCEIELQPSYDNRIEI